MRQLFVFIFVFCGSQVGLAQDTIRLRAINPLANDPAIIKFIAKNAAPFSVVITETAVTPRSIIGSRCGSIQSAYVHLFQIVNLPRKIQIDDQLSPQDSNIIWPACLYVAIYPNGYPAKLRRDEYPAHVYMRLTGGGGSDPAVQRYFQGIDIPKVQKQTTLSAPYVTRPVEFTLDAMSTEAFWLDLQKEAKQALGIEKVVAKIEAPQGAVIVAAEDTSGCKPQSGDPYNVNAVLEAFRHATERAKKVGLTLQRPQITVVDNGFFGADPRGADDMAFDGSPFPSNMFVRETGSLIAKRLQYGKQTIFPLNYSNNVSPDPDSTHGTHVTGLVLGGPAFRPHYKELRGAEGWADITILNVGVGKRQLLEGSDQLLLTNLVENGHIVNMSITYNREAYRNISAIFDDLFKLRRHLYVVSAGNDAIEVADKVYPAGFGGPLSDNVITVGALDDEGRWAAFSNQGVRAIDIAAPGCEVMSWTRNNLEDEAPLSGTSQAAPLVTFTAAMARTFSGRLDVRYLKARLIASGTLLHPRDQDFTAFRVGLNIPRALYWFDDYVRVRKAKPNVNDPSDKPVATLTENWETVEYLGTISQLTGTRCKDSASPSNVRDIWAFKRGKLKDWLYIGKGDGRLSPPCEAALANSGKLAFTPAYRITPEGNILEENEIGENIPLVDVEEVITRSQF